MLKNYRYFLAITSGLLFIAVQAFAMQQDEQAGFRQAALELCIPYEQVRAACGRSDLARKRGKSVCVEIRDSGIAVVEKEDSPRSRKRNIFPEPKALQD